MLLRDIKTELCPICGCSEIVQEWVDTSYFGRDKRCIWEHVNGGRNEHREFLCGCTIKYSPNFRSERIEKACMNDPKILERADNISKTRSSIVSAIDKIDMPEHLKEQLLAKSKELLSDRPDSEFIRDLIMEQNEQM